MFCSNCKKEIDNDSIFCCFCGNQVENTENLNNSETENTDFKTNIPTEDNSHFKKNKLIISIVIVLALLFCTAIFYNTNYGYLKQTKSVTSDSAIINDSNNINEKSNNDDSTSEKHISSSFIYNQKLKPLFANLSADLKNDDLSKNDLVFYNFQKEFSKIIDEMNEKNVDNIFEEDAFESRIIKDNENLYNQMNVSILISEARYYFNENWGELQKNYGKYLSTTYNNWLLYLERNKKIFEDAGLIIEVDKLRENITCLENILKDTNFVAKDDVKETLKFMIGVYLTGIDNTPVFDYENILEPDFKNSYEKFITENQQSKYYSIVKQYYDTLKNNNFKKSDSIESWVRNQIH